MRHRSKVVAFAVLGLLACSQGAEARARIVTGPCDLDLRESLVKCEGDDAIPISRVTFPDGLETDRADIALSCRRTRRYLFGFHVSTKDLTCKRR